MKKNNQHIISEFRTYFKQDNRIDFILVFGSFFSNHYNELSDIDIAIHTKESLDLLVIGKIVSDLENISGRKVDIVELNEIYKRNPLFAFRVVSSSQSIVINNLQKFTDFKRNTFLYYLDTENMRVKFRKKFAKRIDQKRFGKRNYA